MFFILNEERGLDFISDERYQISYPVIEVVKSSHSNRLSANYNDESSDS